MSIEIKSTEINAEGMGVTGLPDTPAMTAEEMQEKFDEIPRACVEQISNIIEDLRTLKTALENIHSHNNSDVLNLLAAAAGPLTYNGSAMATVDYVKEVVQLAGGVVIPQSTAVLRGDGAGGVVEATTDAEPTKDSENLLTSGKVYEAVSVLLKIPTVVSSTPSEDTGIELSDNCIYEIELGAYALTLDVSKLDGPEGAHVFLHITDASASLTISGAAFAYGDSLDDMGAGQYWELSVYKQQVLVKNVTV